MAPASKRGFVLRLLGRLRSNPAGQRRTPNWRRFGQWKRGDQLAAIGLAVAIAGVVVPVIAVPEPPVIAVPEIRVSVPRDPSPSDGRDAISPKYVWPGLPLVFSDSTRPPTASTPINASEPGARTASSARVPRPPYLSKQPKDEDRPSQLQQSSITVQNGTVQELVPGTPVTVPPEDIEGAINLPRVAIGTPIRVRILTPPLRLDRIRAGTDFDGLTADSLRFSNGEEAFPSDTPVRGRVAAVHSGPGVPTLEVVLIALVTPRGDVPIRTGVSRVELAGTAAASPVVWPADASADSIVFKLATSLALDPR